MENRLPNRKRIRLEGYDYSENGAYFITVCTKDRRKLFWDVGADIIRKQNPPLSELGKLVDFSINEISKHYNGVVVDKYCIMPEHIHMILMIGTEENGRMISAPTVSTVVGHMKRWVSMQVGRSIWQKSFVDRIIRDEQMYLGIWKYIDENPLNPEEEE